MKAVVAVFNQEKALIGAFSVITNLRMELFEALLITSCRHLAREEDAGGGAAAGRWRTVSASRRSRWWPHGGAVPRNY